MLASSCKGKRGVVEFRSVAFHPAVQSGQIAAFGQEECADGFNLRLSRSQGADSVPLQAVQGLERA